MADNNTPVNPTEEELLAVERMITGEAAPQAAATSFVGSLITYLQQISNLTQM